MRLPSMTTVLTERGEFEEPDATVSGEALWLSSRRAEKATGWVAKADGMCKADICVPLPPGREQEFTLGSRVNLAALWRHMGQPVVHNDRGDVWVLASSAHDRSAALGSLEAPDFTLPDASGRPHSLSDYRGKKVFLVTWASW
jgi:hypothetical protein